MTKKSIWALERIAVWVEEVEVLSISYGNPHTFLLNINSEMFTCSLFTVTLGHYLLRGAKVLLFFFLKCQFHCISLHFVCYGIAYIPLL